MAAAASCELPALRHYHASPWEQWWTSHIGGIKRWHPDGCEALCSGSCSLSHVVTNESNPLAVWLHLQSVREAASPSDASPSEWHGHPTISYHRVVEPCTGRTIAVPIEPLVGPLRHPYHDCVKRSSMAHSKAYMLPMWRSEVVPPPRRGGTRSYFFDCGASLYSSGSGGASQDWFVGGYAKRELPFDRTLAWEFTNHSDAEILRPLPPHLREATSIHRVPAADDVGCCTGEKLTYFNWGIDGVAGSPRNPLVHLRAVARPDDFVVFKLDVDSPDIELAIVEQILSDSSIASLIDEFLMPKTDEADGRLRTFCNSSIHFWFVL